MRFPPKPPLSAKHAEERLKLAASGLQALALTLFGAGLIAPLFNAALSIPLWMRVAAAICASVSEGAAFEMLRYIPVPNPPKEADDARLSR